MAEACDKRAVVLVTQSELDALDALARRRFGGKRAAAGRAGLALAVMIYADPATIDAETPAEALTAFVHAAKIREVP
jgi:hypothetical protein